MEIQYTFTLESLSVQAVQQRATVAAEGGSLVVVNFEAVRDVDAEATRSIGRPRRV